MSDKFLFACVFAGALSLLWACSEDRETKLDIVISASPPSLAMGESITAELVATEAFFTADIDTPITSEGGLALESVVRRDSTCAIATFVSSAETKAGIHHYELEMGKKTGVLDMSVLLDGQGAGTVTCKGNEASAGASHAQLNVYGEATHFDDDVEVKVIDADEFTVNLVQVENGAWIKIDYSIDLNQTPGTATIKILDGPYAYEVPFTILPPVILDNVKGEQVLTKGQVGLVKVSNPDAEMGAWTAFGVGDFAVEAGAADVISETEVEIPVRVPFDYAEDHLDLVARTFSGGGAFLEMVNVPVRLREPAYIVITPSMLDLTSPGEQKVSLAALGADLSALESLTLETNDQLSLASWQADSATAGLASFVVGAAAQTGGYELTAREGGRDIVGVLGLSGPLTDVFEARHEVAAGDHLYIPLVIESGALNAADAVIYGDDDIEIINLIYVDENCVVAEVAVSPGAYAGDTGTLHTLKMKNDDDEYTVYFELVESGL